MNNSAKNCLKTAFDHYQTAEHLFHTTLPIAKEPKLLLGIMQSLANSLEHALESIFIQEKLASPQNLLQKINAVRSLAAKYHLSPEDIVFMLRIQEILYQQKRSPVEFNRGSSHVLCSDDYDLEVISVQEVEKFLHHTKKILNLLNSA